MNIGMNLNSNNAAMSWVSWTGGSEPPELHTATGLEQDLVKALFEAQLAAFRAFWGKEPDAGTRDTFIRRARFDAHATVRAGCIVEPS